MKRLSLLLLLLVAGSAPAQDIILGVLETGDYTITIDTTTFFWGTLPDAEYVPFGWGGPPGTADTFEFETYVPGFPAHLWLDYHRGGTMMARETIIGLIQDYWYDLPRGDKGPTRVKFLRSPGIEEGSRTDLRPYRLTANPNPFSSGTLLRVSTPDRAPVLEIYDASGRAVLESPLAICHSPFALDLRSLPAGVYLCRLRNDATAPPLRLIKLN